MKLGMEILSPSFVSNPSYMLEESKSTKWTIAENKMFENALAVFDKDTPDRWHKVAAMVPGKTVGDVIRQYKVLEDDVSNIEAGLVPIPSYSASPFTLELVNNNGFEGLKHGYGPCGKRSSSTRPDQERKKGVPWTEDEHRLFLMGLKKYGKGDWRNISRNFVITRTPTQVASHAQKYFIRQLSGGKDKRRASIHDITTVNLPETRTSSPDNKRSSTSPEQPTALPQQPNSVAMPRTTSLQWNQPTSGAAIAFNPTHGNMFMSPPYGINSFELKMQGQNLHRGSVHQSYIEPQSMVFQLQSAQHYPHV
ncbi:transcription factor DIVARICATA-like [Malania oleifera]|uniref:transcription factor DIVARICATA-like n=1 Tax=Malania oleifera TaxID=397392 RepID=UPI0025AEA4A0|nr:transcription factor DIVARICATA-like [Malania oleifera]